MSGAQRRGWDPGAGAFGRLTRTAYWLLAVEVAFLVAASPGLIGVLLLERHVSNIPLYALCAVPIGPALSAALYSLRETPGSGELEPWRRFWRGWRMNVAQTLAVWIPAVLLAAITGFNLAFSVSDGIQEFLTIAGAVLAVAVLVWSIGSIVIVSTFRFRTADVARLGVYGLGVRPLVALGILSLLVLAAAIAAFTSDWVLAALGALFALALLTTARPMTRAIEKRFIVR